MTKTLGILTMVAAATLVGLGACKGPTTKKADPTAQAMNADSLYQRLGGEGAIRDIANGWCDKIAQDEQLKARFGTVNMERYKTKMIAQLGELTGGPQIYTGKDMVTAHKGMNISEAEWNAYMGDLKAAMEQAKVPALEREELLVKLEPMKSQIVGQ